MKSKDAVKLNKTELKAAKNNQIFKSIVVISVILVLVFFGIKEVFSVINEIIKTLQRIPG
jgi:hypothetical protein